MIFFFDRDVKSQIEHVFLTLARKPKSANIKITLVLLNPNLSVFENTVDPDQLASDEYFYVQ